MRVIYTFVCLTAMTQLLLLERIPPHFVVVILFLRAICMEFHGEPFFVLPFSLLSLVAAASKSIVHGNAREGTSHTYIHTARS